MTRPARRGLIRQYALIAAFAAAYLLIGLVITVLLNVFNHMTRIVER